ncbi:MAG: hypothetical protein K2Y42_06625 [Hyphomicrobium sp.]|uniref:hypothetical protein n=1 Tax=Hyphomicrobium sp. TaxID=82 RepID=UPI0025B9CDE9|nr:hypothetical protein [Hyphomicrobium sp.]MBX9862412.1 hypothetical protein [Hyphomicrobium sp.]
MLKEGCFLFLVLLAGAIMVSSMAQADDREQRLREMIGHHRHLAQTVGQGIDTSEAGNLGTAFNEMGVNEFRCAALAFLFGKDEIFKRLGKIEETPRQTYLETPLAVLGDSLLHTNWALAADGVLVLSERNRVETWNLDCVRQYDIGEEHARARIAPAAEFEIHEDQLHVLGDIDEGFYDRFAAFLSGHPGVKYVAMGSGGGSVRDAILAGMLIRRRGLETTLMADCYSACPLLFLGGVSRTVWSPYRRLGFHQVSRNGQALPLDDDIYGVIRKYTENMGANGAFVLKSMQSAAPRDMSYPDVWDLCEPGITTWVQRGC